MSKTLKGLQRGHYQFSSCLRMQTGRCRHKTLPNSAEKALKRGLLSAEHSPQGVKSTIKSIAACAYRYWAGGRLGTQKRPKTAQKQHFQSLAAGLSHWPTQTEPQNRYEFNSCLRNQIKDCRHKTPSKMNAQRISTC